MLAHTSTLCIVYILYIVYARKRIVHNVIEIEMHQLYTISYSYSVPCHIYASSAERTSDPTNEWRTTATAAATKNKQVYLGYNEKNNISYIYIWRHSWARFTSTYIKLDVIRWHTHIHAHTHSLHLRRLVRLKLGLSTHYRVNKRFDVIHVFIVQTTYHIRELEQSCANSTKNRIRSRCERDRCNALKLFAMWTSLPIADTQKYKTYHRHENAEPHRTCANAKSFLFLLHRRSNDILRSHLWRKIKENNVSPYNAYTNMQTSEYMSVLFHEHDDIVNRVLLYKINGWLLVTTTEKRLKKNEKEWL